ncbi:MAG: corrinoid protein [candidate division WOR-3 bacterium]
MDFSEIKKALVDLDVSRVKELIFQSLKENYPPEAILKEGLIAGMKEVGELFSKKEYFVPEVLIAADAFYAGFDLITPLLKSKGEKRGKIVIGVVSGDIHDIGKNIVKVMLKANGYEVIDLGRDVPHEKFIKAVAEEKPQVLALSALMTTTMFGMEEIIQILKEKGLRDKIKVIVGGAAVNEKFAQMIGADGYGEDATAAVKLIERLNIG